MKGKTDSERFGIELLTPVHVGSGAELYEGMDFVVRNAEVFVVDQGATFDAVAAGTADLGGVETLNLDDLVHMAGNDLGYRLPSLSSGETVPERFREQVKDAHLTPYIPGSSIKGAIRTAIAVAALEAMNGPSLAERISRDGGRRGSSTRPRPDSADDKLMAKVFGDKPNTDLLRALHVGDARFEPAELRLADIRFLNVMRRNGRDAPRWRHMASKQSEVQWNRARGVHVEALRPGASAEMRLAWDRFLLADLARWKAPRDVQLPSDFGALSRLLNGHARRLLEGEIAFFQGLGVDGPRTQCAGVLSLIDEEADAAYLRLSWGSGWRGITGDWMDKATLDAARRRYRLGKWINVHGQYKPIDPFPKTRRLAVDGSPLLPLGWVRLRPWDPWRERKKVASTRHPWVDKTLEEIQRRTKTQPFEALRGRALAEAWRSLHDPGVKKATLADIRARWQEHGWWEARLRGAARDARSIYEGGGS